MDQEMWKGTGKRDSSNPSGHSDEHYLTGEEVCEKLHVSRRTLQALRDEKAIPYTSITAAGGKLLYPESGLYEVLKKTTRTSGDMPDKQTARILNKKTPSAGFEAEGVFI